MSDWSFFRQMPKIPLLFTIDPEMQYARTYDVIVIGGGHAGAEAALAAARAGSKTLLLTHSIETLGQMSCNPAIGGIGKGHLVKEIDALGGAMARVIDRAGIQFRTLNSRKGPAVRATRAQADRVLYRQAMREVLENQPGLTLFQQAVNDLIVEGSAIVGVETAMGLQFHAPAVVLTVGTFLGGKIHIGESNYQGGRAGDPPANRLAARLRELPLNVGRLKTGTPPRIDGRTIDYSRLTEQAGDQPIPTFSYTSDPALHPEQISCHITYTNQRTHDIIRDGLSQSPLFTGVIDGVGPRYCPSVEDKIVRFADKDAHQIFVEPEGLSTHEVYPNGISTSLSFDTQYAFVQSIQGFENAHITRPGYAIEYDFFDPRDLQYSLETKCIQGLFFAGQINGTTGYEEAAAQGLIAGLNAALKVQNKPAWTPKRDEAYIGVLIDDLITQGTLEPYRMFTSRAEYRLTLREDNADLRLTQMGRQLNLVGDEQWRLFETKREAVELEKQRLGKLRIKPENMSLHEAESVLGAPLSRDVTAADLLKRPEVGMSAISQLSGPFPDYFDKLEMPLSLNQSLNRQVQLQTEIQAKYQGYIARQAEDIARARRNEDKVLPQHLDYADISGLSTEIREKLSNLRPETLGQASRIAGVTPAAVSVLLVHLKRLSGRRKSA